MKKIKTIQIGNLLWQIDPPDKRMTWYEAMAYAASLGTGFRLPTIDELYVMCYHTTEKLFDNGFDWHSDCYWSTESYKYDCSLAWILDISNGIGGWYDKTRVFHCRCVRKAKEN